MNSIQCVSSVQFAVYSISCLSWVWWTVYGVQCPVYSVHCTVYSAQCTDSNMIIIMLVLEMYHSQYSLVWGDVKTVYTAHTLLYCVTGREYSVHYTLDIFYKLFTFEIHSWAHINVFYWIGPNEQFNEYYIDMLDHFLTLVTSYFVPIWAYQKTVSVLWREEGYTMKCSLSPRKIQSQNRHSQLQIQHWPSWEINTGKGNSRQLGNTRKYGPVDWGILEW